MKGQEKEVKKIIDYAFRSMQELPLDIIINYDEETQENQSQLTSERR